MKKRVAIPIIAVLLVLVVVLAALYINNLTRFSRGNLAPDEVGDYSVDSVSSASMMLSSSEYTLENATDVFSLPNLAVVISTVNADGTPNAASMQPIIIDNETIAVMSSLGNQTLMNIANRKYAVFTVYSVNTDSNEMGTGARLVVEQITDEAELAEKKAAYKESTGKDVMGLAVLLKVVKVLPLT